MPQRTRRPRGAGMRSGVGKHVHRGLGYRPWGRRYTYTWATEAPAAATGMGAVVAGTAIPSSHAGLIGEWESG